MSEYRVLAETLDAVARERGKLAKIERFAEILDRLEGKELKVAARLATGTPFAEWEQAVTSVGWVTVARAASEITGWDLETIGACAAAIGDLGEAVGLLLTSEPRDPMTIQEVEARLRELGGERKAAAKQAAVAAMLRRCSPVEGKYLVKTLSGGLRIGADATTVEEAIAQAFGVDREAVARARRDCGDIGETAVAAREGRLSEIVFRLFHPIGFMLATPIETASEVAEELPLFAIEDKYDGIRAHAHKSNGRVALFSRTLDDVTAQFPEVAESLAKISGSFLLDGEILAWREGRPDSFFRLQRRLGRKAPAAELLSEIPVAFMAYDCLARDARPLFEEEWSVRRRELEALSPAGLLVSPVFAAKTPAEVDRLFDEARARGNEGLMLKRRDSSYQAGKRGRAWRKYKKALATLDVVVTAVQQGNGKRAGMLSDYTFAVRDGDRFVNIGKAYSGLTDEEIRKMGALFRKITTARYGPVRAVEPRVVLEVSFDSIQKSARHKSGFALRFPRIVRLREDKRPEEVDTLQTVAEIYEKIIGVRGEPRSNPSG
ncbi:MAG TPA: ATP-dependent DNA ligase, partial [Thermoanaerobaculia bacterium]|nr:ATP-dependent DNA ligase [Thermoanaerobaculia bacterium]